MFWNHKTLRKINEFTLDTTIWWKMLQLVSFSPPLTSYYKNKEAIRNTKLYTGLES